MVGLEPAVLKIPRFPAHGKPMSTVFWLHTPKKIYLYNIYILYMLQKYRKKRERFRVNITLHAHVYIYIYVYIHYTARDFFN